MSLFGDDNTSGSRPKASLFDDDNTQKPDRPSTSSMFADSSSVADNDTNSPWGFTPKKSAGRGNPVKTLLANADVPDLYIDTFDAAAQGNSRVDAQHCRQLLRESRVSPADQSQIWKIVSGGADIAAFERGEFNVLLALIGLAQEGEELGLDAVDDRRTRLPVPQLASLVQHPASRSTATAAQTSSPVASPRAQQQSHQPRKPSFGAGFREDSDPWNSPALHKGHNHPQESSNGQAAENGTGRRTTSSYTTNTISETSENLASSNYGAGPAAGHTESTSWGASTSFGVDSENFGSTITTPGGGFGDHHAEASASTPRRPAQPRVVTGKGVEEIITVNLLGEKEGLFLFQHRNYEVASVRRNSKVIRRYSDFVWLLECLHKRYPFRQLPLLPPKRVAINGNHIVADTLFIEKRRRGLARFANALVRHPVLREEQLVIMFLTVPTVGQITKTGVKHHTNLSRTGAFRLAQTGHHQRTRRVPRQNAPTRPRRQPPARPHYHL
jgi:sorting nexin-8